MEAKAGPLGVMTLPTSLQQANPEHYSGQGRDQDGEDANTPSASRTPSGEEGEIEGSGEGSDFPGGFALKTNNVDRSGVELGPETKSSLSQSQTEPVTVAEHTTLSQWQLVDQPTTPSQGSQEPEPAEEARGEILYVRRPTIDVSSASLQRGEGTSNSGFTPVFRKHGKGKGTSRKEVLTSTPEALMEVLTSSEMTTVELLTTTDSQQTDPTSTTAATEKLSDRATTEEPSISISWIREEEEKTSTADPQVHLSATPAASSGARTTMGVTQLTTFASGSNGGATEMESRSAVSESFVVGSQWTAFKGTSPKSEEQKPSATTEKKDDKDASNPFGIPVPNWAFGLIPSGM